MIIQRQASETLEKWKQNPNRKPLILRGARQVGKSFLAKEFAKSYDQFILLNLEKEEDRRIFDFNNLSEIIDYLFLKNQLSKEKQTLLFIDEIQESTKAIQLLRYFYEDYPQIHTIAAGSLLEFALADTSAFPVGRIEQIPIYPISFFEFLRAVHPPLVDIYHQVPISEVGHSLLLPYFNTYTILGGMPEIVKTYIETKDWGTLHTIYDNLWQSYKDDTEKYARNKTNRNVLRHILNYGHFEKDRVTFQRFANSDYKSREISEAFQSIEMAKIIQLIYPITSTEYPPIPNLNRSPRLQYLDTGILNHLLTIQAEMTLLTDLSDFMRGKIIQHIVSQELIAMQSQLHFKPEFWVREKYNSSAEVDNIFISNHQIIPVEVKSGNKGRLKSLMQFVDESNVNLAIRISANLYLKERVYTIQKKEFTLYNIPYFHIEKIKEYLEL